MNIRQQGERQSDYEVVVALRKRIPSLHLVTLSRLKLNESMPI